MKKTGLSGVFVAIDGPDGCGKSTQCRLLAERLEAAGVDLETLRDPGATRVGEKIRKILLDKEHTEICTRTELLLYMAARAQLWHEKIRPALEAGRFVLLDRWLSSTCAYQGHAGGFGAEKVDETAAKSLERAWPDLTMVLDIDPARAASRLKGRPDRIEAKGIDYHRMVREGFLELARSREDVTVIDASLEPQSVHEAIAGELSSRFGSCGL